MSQRLSVGIFIFDNVEVLDFAGPFEVFSRTRLTPGLDSRRSDDTAPFTVLSVAERPAMIEATGGLHILPHYGFSDAPAIDLLVIPGGWGTRPLLEHAPVLEWIRDRASRATLVTSVCTGALLLARAGLLHQRRATTHWGALEQLARIDPTIVVQPNARFVDDGPITSAGISAGIDMSLAVVARLHGQAVAADTARYMDYGRAGVSSTADSPTTA